MSEGEESTAGGWWGGWIQAAKEKSSSALQLVKRDLAEFTNTMQEDSSKMATTVKEKLTQENATAAGHKVKEGVTSLLGGLSRALVIEPDDDYQPARIVGGEAIVFDRAKARLYAVQIDPATYTTEPTIDRYQDWLKTFNIDEMKGDISQLLVSNVEVRALYTQLVPLTVSNVDFWRRYYFRYSLLEEDENRRIEIMKRADGTQEQKEIGWDEDDDEWSEARTRVPAAEPSPTSRVPVPDPVSSIPETLAPEIPTQSTATISGPTNDLPEATIALPADPIIEKPSALETVPNIPDEIRVDETPIQTLDVSTDLKTETPIPGDPNPRRPKFHKQSVAACMVPDSPESLTVVTDGQSTGSSRSSEEPSLGGWSELSDAGREVSGGEDDPLRTKELHGNLIAVGPMPERTTPSDESSNTKESLDDDWEKDFDVEVTEEDLHVAQEKLKTLATSTPAPGEKTRDADNEKEKGEDWEDW